MQALGSLPDRYLVWFWKTFTSSSWAKQAQYVVFARSKLASELRWCISARALPEGKRLHARIVDGGYGEDRFLGNLLIQMYQKCGRLEEARAVFDVIPRRNVATWSLMIAAYTQQGHYTEAVELYQRIGSDDLEPDSFTFANVLSACSRLGDIETGKAIDAHIVSRELHMNVVVGNALINMYTKCGSLADARTAFDRMPWKDNFSWNTITAAYAQQGHLDEARCMFDKIPEGDAVSWTTMISAYAQHGHADKAINLYRKMHLGGVKADCFTFTAFLGACSRPRDLKDGEAVHACMNEHRLQMDAAVENALLIMYAKCGSLENAKRVFDRIPRRNLVAYSAMVSAYAQQGHLDLAMVLFNSMVYRDVAAWNAIITAHAQQGHGNEAIELFKRMMWEQVEPNRFTFASILEACSSVKDLETGKAIHARIVEHGLQDVVLDNALVNMYANCGTDAMTRGNTQLYQKLSSEGFLADGSDTREAMEQGRL